MQEPIIFPPVEVSDDSNGTIDGVEIDFINGEIRSKGAINLLRVTIIGTPKIIAYASHSDL
jgi:hypothetical protein